MRLAGGVNLFIQDVDALHKVTVRGRDRTRCGFLRDADRYLCPTAANRDDRTTGFTGFIRFENDVDGVASCATVVGVKL